MSAAKPRPLIQESSVPRQLSLILLCAALLITVTACLPEPLADPPSDTDMPSPTGDMSTLPPTDMTGTDMSTPTPDMGDDMTTPTPDMSEPLVNPFSGDADAIMRGQTLYSSNGCVGCHGDSGAGSIANTPWSAAIPKGNAYLFASIKDGIQPTMPAFSSVLSDDQVWELISHLEAVAAQ